MIRRRLCVACASILFLFVAFPAPSTGAESVGQKIGEGIDRAIGSVKEGWKEVRTKVDQMGVEARLYARLHWDKGLTAASITIDVRKGGVAVLRGTVASEAAKAKAEQLAGDTVGVEQVDNQLKIAPAK